MMNEKKRLWTLSFIYSFYLLKKVYVMTIWMLNIMMVIFRMCVSGCISLYSRMCVNIYKLLLLLKIATKDKLRDIKTE